MAIKQLLGELLVEKGLVTQKDIDIALRIQVGGNRRLGTILMKMGLISDEDLLNLLSKQQGVPRVDIEKEINQQTARILPRYLCHKYSLIPLAEENGQSVLKVAMVDPLDAIAISDVEGYTGKAVLGVPASGKEISHAISKYVPFTIKDIINPQSYNYATKIASIVALVLALVTIGFIYNYFEREKYGLTSYLEEQTIYKNNDLIVSYEKAGKISLLGHGAYADGYYAVLFNDKDSLIRFVEKKKDTFSEKQLQWITWVTQQNPQKKNR